jgi:hypothetical protein
VKGTHLWQRVGLPKRVFTGVGSILTLEHLVEDLEVVRDAKRILCVGVVGRRGV